MNFLKQKWPIPVKISLMIASIPFVLIFYDIFFDRGYNKENIYAFLLFSSLASWWFLEHTGYKFGYSEAVMSSRPAGLVWEPLPRRHHFSEVEYSDIIEIRKVFQGNENAKKNFFAFDYLGLEGSDGQTVMLYPDGMRHEDFRMMLQKIYEKRPDLFVKKWQKNLVGAA